MIYGDESKSEHDGPRTLDGWRAAPLDPMLRPPAGTPCGTHTGAPRPATSAPPAPRSTSSLSVRSRRSRCHTVIAPRRRCVLGARSGCHRFACGALSVLLSVELRGAATAMAATLTVPSPRSGQTALMC